MYTNLLIRGLDVPLDSKPIANEEPSRVCDPVERPSMLGIGFRSGMLPPNDGCCNSTPIMYQFRDTTRSTWFPHTDPIFLGCSGLQGGTRCLVFLHSPDLGHESQNAIPLLCKIFGDPKIFLPTHIPSFQALHSNPITLEKSLKREHALTDLLSNRKLVIAVFLSSGIFVIAASIIRTALTLKAEPSSITVNRWGIRETFVGVATVNLPILRPLFTKRFWKSNYVEDGSSGHPYGYHGGSESYNLTTRTKKSARRESMKAINESSQDGGYDVYVSTSYNVKVEQKHTREGESSDGHHPSSVWEIDKKSIV
ncbi:hypothetical protein BDV30DRAFT_230177 [Aspergillus minisclerotigenes]|uniref:Uncharacterized protein n=1 Tax=Aspergillus minisclerotigenes TaxID=656917 RepID=A0A5N6ISX9_9EURO|nr:hypothetical protein BDV30DRAFT_230177 [Aspergillus minisclerotigenes]